MNCEVQCMMGDVCKTHMQMEMAYHKLWKLHWKMIINQSTESSEISSYDKCKTWLVHTRQQKNCQNLLTSLFQVNRFSPVILSNPV